MATTFPGRKGPDKDSVAKARSPGPAVSTSARPGKPRPQAARPMARGVQGGRTTYCPRQPSGVHDGVPNQPTGTVDQVPVTK